MKRIHVIGGLLVIGIASTISITPVKASTVNTKIVTDNTNNGTKKESQISWDSVRAYLGYDQLYAEYHKQNIFKEYVRLQEEEDELVQIFLNKIRIMKEIEQYKIYKQKKNKKLSI
ncbi:hypothetical protein CN553_24880 [Bacillus cereus]|uniref:Uncharacterized protein n=1 Tax=Bacillus cereus TaxID=1396 RepID=A0A9X6U827_BACCE|nr:hypothetical protein [Bacillus cereus]PEN87104.1 hypothetical protein CN553_24880 [Bacillus cereus]